MNIDFDDINRACEVLKSGGIILYPTDTVWGIGCDATNAEAVKRVFDIKKRADSKALILLVADVAALEHVVDDVPDVALQLIEVANRPVTVVYDGAGGVADEVKASDGSVAVRVTDEPISHQLCKSFRRPLVSTSANVSGRPSPVSFDEISPEIISAVDYVMVQGRNQPPRQPSIIIKISADSSFKILRK